LNLKIPKSDRILSLSSKILKDKNWDYSASKMDEIEQNILDNYAGKQLS
jgi:hypothetical protein